MNTNKKEKLSWNKQMDFDLMEFMYKKRHVWDCKHPEYVDTDFKQQAFEDFAIKYKNGLTGSAVKVRWTNIRTVFSCNLRRIKRHKRATGRIYNPTWHLWDACHYLMNSYSKKKKKTRIDSHDIKIELPTETDNLLFLDNSFEDTTPQNDLASNKDPIHVESVKVRSLNGTNKGNRKERIEPDDNNLISSCEKVLGTLSNLLNPIKSESSNNFQEPNSEFQHIGKFVTERLCKMKTFDAECAIQKIMNVLVLYSQNNPNNPNSTHNNSN